MLFSSRFNKLDYRFFINPTPTFLARVIINRVSENPQLPWPLLSLAFSSTSIKRSYHFCWFDDEFTSMANASPSSFGETLFQQWDFSFRVSICVLSAGLASRQKYKKRHQIRFTYKLQPADPFKDVILSLLWYSALNYIKSQTIIGERTAVSMGFLLFYKKFCSTFIRDPNGKGLGYRRKKKKTHTHKKI